MARQNAQLRTFLNFTVHSSSRQYAQNEEEPRHSRDSQHNVCENIQLLFAQSTRGSKRIYESWQAIESPEDNVVLPKQYLESPEAEGSSSKNPIMQQVGHEAAYANGNQSSHQHIHYGSGSVHWWQAGIWKDGKSLNDIEANVQGNVERY